MGKRARRLRPSRDSISDDKVDSTISNRHQTISAFLRTCLNHFKVPQTHPLKMYKAANNYRLIVRMKRVLLLSDPKLIST